MRPVLVDAGALIALLDRSDAHHAGCVEALKGIRAPLVTVWPAFTEAMYLLADVPRAPAALCDMIQDGAIGVLDLAPMDVARMKQLMQKYADRPMDVADAALVCVAERDGLTTILSFDRDFRIYRLPGGRKFVVLP